MLSEMLRMIANGGSVYTYDSPDGGYCEAVRMRDGEYFLDRFPAGGYSSTETISRRGMLLALASLLREEAGRAEELAWLEGAIEETAALTGTPEGSVVLR